MPVWNGPARWPHALKERAATNQREVYALEQLLIAAEPERELKLQAARIGDLGLTALPNEVYAITGLKLKAQSPLRSTFNVELANGADGYIPPPEQHVLGGYTTWAARTAGLEAQAEPRIVEAVLGLLERVAGAKRRPVAETHGAYAQTVLASGPRAYWRLNEINPPVAGDASPHGNGARYEPGVALYLPGAQTAADAVSAVPESPSAFSGAQINRAPHFAGGRVVAKLPSVGGTYSVSVWLWNGLPADARPVAGHVFSRGRDDSTAGGEHLGITGSAAGPAAGRLTFAQGTAAYGSMIGRTVLGLRRWHHVVLVRDGATVRVHLDGRPEAEIEATVEMFGNDPATMVFVGGRADRADGFEGRLDEVAIFDRALSAAEISAQFRASGR